VIGNQSEWAIINIALKWWNTQTTRHFPSYKLYLSFVLLLNQLAYAITNCQPLSSSWVNTIPNPKVLQSICNQNGHSWMGCFKMRVEMNLTFNSRWKTYSYASPQYILGQSSSNNKYSKLILDLNVIFGLNSTCLVAQNHWIFIWLTHNCFLFPFFLNMIFSNLMLMNKIWPKLTSYNKFSSKHLELKFFKKLVPKSSNYKTWSI
jgi:hypothetical protein